MRYRHGEKAKCSVCGAHAVAVWHGEQSVDICADCALGVLPALIADAVWSAPHTGVGRFTDALDRFHASYWKAVAARIALEAKPRA